MAPELAKLCGSHQPSIINSTDNQLFVKLRTDSSVSAGGFLASYTSGMTTHTLRILIRALTYYPVTTLASFNYKFSVLK